MKTALAVTILFAATLSAEVKETVHLKVTGGPNAGTYDATTERGGCSVGLAGPNSWGNQLSSSKDTDPKHFNSLQLVVPHAEHPADFFLSVAFGPLMKRSATYRVETRTGQMKSGSGAVHVKDAGKTATIAFDAKTADGVKLEGTIDCRSVVRATAPK